MSSTNSNLGISLQNNCYLCPPSYQAIILKYLATCKSIDYRSVENIHYCPQRLPNILPKYTISYIYRCSLPRGIAPQEILYYSYTLKPVNPYSPSRYILLAYSTSSIDILVLFQLYYQYTVLLIRYISYTSCSILTSTEKEPQNISYPILQGRFYNCLYRSRQQIALASGILSTIVSVLKVEYTPSYNIERGIQQIIQVIF